ncbi:hypothetical protein [Streptomyces sp. PanSC9]|uniref:hypothetical protein n=1 Tax=Streptomyces sp. PanSC9 TaxID=1520461 RepID=UPI000F496D77|nr:hypothetical protein [Streptomyces sp. PanSC9]ROP48032.1 hypothetical protein EDD94_7768 [Streptomyces sp. PanSC9]
MVIVACLLLPMAAVLLYAMDRLEDWLNRTPQPPRHARHGHLRLIDGGRQETLTPAQAGRRNADAA